MLKNRNVFPPGGFVYYQPETGWTAPGWGTFDATVAAIVNHRRANPQHKFSTDPRVVEMELDAYTVHRLQDMPGGQEYILPGAPPPNFHLARLRPRLLAVVAGAKDKIQNAVAGIGLWLEWFGDKPVAPELAEQRALICVKCPHNGGGDVFQRFNQKTGEELKKIFASMQEEKMQTSQDDKLQVCLLCDCPLKAKVHSPLQIILNHLRPEVTERLPDFCWIKAEVTVSA